MKQLPLLPRRCIDDRVDFLGGSIAEWLLPRALELVFTSWDVQPFAEDCRWDGPPFRWNDDRRQRIRAEIDAALFHLYLPADGTGDWDLGSDCEESESTEHCKVLFEGYQRPRQAISYILDTFPIVRRKDEQIHGEFRTKRLVLEIYDEMQESIGSGNPFETRLDPPPGPPVDAAGNFVSYSNIADRPPPHIHSTSDAGSDA